MVLDQQIARGVELLGKTEESTTEVPGSVSPLITMGLLSSAQPCKKGSALSAAGFVLYGSFTFVLCFMMPITTLFTLSWASSGSFMVVSLVGSMVEVSTSPANFLISLSFLVVKVPVLRFLKRYDGVANH